MHTTDFRELETWKQAIKLSKTTYYIIEDLPKHESFALADQMRRAVVSVPSNIAEGCGRETLKEFIHFLYIARGSLFELDTQIEICKELNYISEENYHLLYKEIDITRRMLNKLIKYYKSKS